MKNLKKFWQVTFVFPGRIPGNWKKGQYLVEAKNEEGAFKKAAADLYQDGSTIIKKIEYFATA
jgi:hypothetical protein